RARGIYPGTLPLDRVEVLGFEDGVTTSLQLSRNSRPPMLDHQDKYMMKAQVHVSKSSAISGVQALPLRKHYCQIYQVVKHMLRRRLLASFQDHEREGGDTRSQDGIKDNDLKIKIQDHSMQMIYQRNSQEQGSKFQESDGNDKSSSTLITTIITYPSDFTCTTRITPQTNCSCLSGTTDSYWSTLSYPARWDQFTSDDSSRDSSSDPLSETSLDSHSDTSSDSSSRHSSLCYAISNTPCDSQTATSERPSRKRYRSLTLSIPVSSPVCEALSLVCAELLPPPKRIRYSDSMTDLEISSEDGYESYVPREVGLGVDIEDSYEPYMMLDIESDVQEEIDECITHADAIRARGMDDRDVVENAAT
nr:hypothetical protein [Tanacetum cinerariifolium]